MPTTKRQLQPLLAMVEEVAPGARRALGPYSGVTTISLTGSGATLVLTAQQAQNRIIQLTGAARSGGVTLQFPNPTTSGGNGVWFVDYGAVTGLASDHAISLAVGTGVFAGEITGSETSTLAIAVAHTANTAPAVLLGA